MSNKKVTVNARPQCNFCSKAAFFDGKTIHGPWAFMCKQHMKAVGVGLGLGLGQMLVLEDVVTYQTGRCMHCDQLGSIEMTAAEVRLWKDPERPNIQDCFPSWSKGKREQLMSGTHSECFEQMFAPEREDYEPSPYDGTYSED